jgi:serine/threonine protein kinase
MLFRPSEGVRNGPADSPLSDSSADGNHLNIFLEYVPGGSVAALLNNYGAFEEALVRNFVRQILTGLNYLHEREIVHRDIKGANILVDNKGGIKISDFGISKKVENSESELRCSSFSPWGGSGGGGVACGGSRMMGLRGQPKALLHPWVTANTFSSHPRIQGEPALSPGLGLLDGSRSGQADELYLQSRHLECRVSRRGDAHGHASLGRVDPDASDLSGAW